MTYLSSNVSEFACADVHLNKHILLLDTKVGTTLTTDAPSIDSHQLYFTHVNLSHTMAFLLTYFRPIAPPSRLSQKPGSATFPISLTMFALQDL
jgi:hypothetical protein